MTVFGAKRILGKLLMPAKCYLPDYAMQQDLFDHLDPGSEKQVRKLKAKRSLGLEIDGEKGL